MKEKEPSELTDKDLLEKAMQPKLSPTMNALFVGIMIGIIIFSVAVKSVGIFTLIPLYFAYRLIKNSKEDKAVSEEIKTRNLT